MLNAPAWLLSAELTDHHVVALLKELVEVLSLGLFEEHEVVAVTNFCVKIQLTGCCRAGAAYLVDNCCHSLLLSFEFTIKVELSASKVATKGSQENLPIVDHSSEIVMTIDVAKLFLGRNEHTPITCFDPIIRMDIIYPALLLSNEGEDFGLLNWLHNALYD